MSGMHPSCSFYQMQNLVLLWVVFLSSMYLPRAYLREVPCIPSLDGESVLGCCCHFLPLEPVISLGSRLAFSFYPLLWIVPLDPEDKICLNHSNISLFASYGIQAHHYHYSRIIFFLQSFQPFCI